MQITHSTNKVYPEITGHTQNKYYLVTLTNKENFVNSNSAFIRGQTKWSK